MSHLKSSRSATSQGLTTCHKHYSFHGHTNQPTSRVKKKWKASSAVESMAKCDLGIGALYQHVYTSTKSHTRNDLMLHS